MTKPHQIEAVITAVAKYHNLDPVKVFQSFSCAHKPMSKARTLIWFHLHDCGMSLYEIARLFKISYDQVQRKIKQGQVAFTDEDLTLLATLPRISNTIKLCKH